MQVLGCLMKNTLLLTQIDKYRLTVNDFTTNFEKIIFSSIYNMSANGANSISIVDFDSYLEDYKDLKVIYSNNNGITYLQDAEQLSDLTNFKYHYSRVKKFSALRALQKDGFDISEFYCEDVMSAQYSKIQARFNEMDVNDIFDRVKEKLFGLENVHTSTSTRGAITVADGLANLKEQYKLAPEIGNPLQGDILNTVIRGARKGKFNIVSMPTGGGKSRLAVGDACYLAFPIYWCHNTKRWIERDYYEKVLVITTELDESEIQTMVLAWVSGINEDVILSGKYTQEEEERVDTAIKVIEHFKDNFHLERLPNPNIAQLESTVRKHALTNKIQSVFYDYIFSSPSVLSEYRDLRIREDERKLRPLTYFFQFAAGVTSWLTGKSY